MIALNLVLLSMLAFQIKHFLCDFVLQTSDQIRYKGVYLHPTGLVHSGVHMIGSLPALLILTRAPVPIAILLLVELAVHYHTDWGKSRIDARMRLNDQNTLYWTIFGLDQLIHQLTYLGMIYAVLYWF